MAYLKEIQTCAYACMCAKSLQLCPTLCDPTDSSLPGSSDPWDSSGKNTGVSWCPPPGDLQNPEMNLHLLHWQMDSFPLVPLGKLHPCTWYILKQGANSLNTHGFYKPTRNILKMNE